MLVLCMDVYDRAPTTNKTIYHQIIVQYNHVEKTRRKIAKRIVKSYSIILSFTYFGGVSKK